MKARLLASAFVFSFAFAIASFAVPFYAERELGARPEHLGLIQLTAAAAYALGSVLFGRLSDKVGRRRMSALGCLGTAAAFFLLRCTDRLWQVFPIYVLSGLSQAAFWPALEVELMTCFSRERLHAGVSAFNLSWCAAMGIGCAFAGRMYEQNPLLCFETSAALCVVTSALVFGRARRREAKSPAGVAAGR